jgi:UDP-glucose 4-epimerase
MNCPEAVGTVVNIGDDREISINHLATRVKELTRSSSSIVHIPYEKAYTEGFEDMVRRVPDITLAKKLIGFKPKYGLDDILCSVIEALKIDFHKT